MKDDGLILAAWAEAAGQNSAAILATVMKVSGSAYRSPGARMLITEKGGRTGSISGGCLESDVLKKAWWLTAAHGAAVQIYDNTSEEEAVWEFGLGCNGIVHLLLERWENGSRPLTIDLLTACRIDRRGGVLATMLSSPGLGQKLALFPDSTTRSEITNNALSKVVEEAAHQVWDSRKSIAQTLGGDAEVFIEFIPPPVPLLIVGAGHDALPVVRLAKELGWHVTVIDGRANQARAERFPQADCVFVAPLDNPIQGLIVDDQTVAVIMSHSYPQDSAFLKALRAYPLRYLGVLGPRKRTERMLAESGDPRGPVLHCPIGLDIGADTPEEIALAIVSEIQAALTRRPGGMLRYRRGPIHQSRDRPSIVPEANRA